MPFKKAIKGLGMSVYTKPKMSVYTKPKMKATSMGAKKTFRKPSNGIGVGY